MPPFYPHHFLRYLRNQVPIDRVIVKVLNLEVRYANHTLRFRCPLCRNFHTAINPKTNLARCFDCQKNFNPIDMVIAVGKCDFLQAVDILKNTIE